MLALPVPAESAVIAALRAYLSTVVPSSVTIIRGQVNRVSEPSGTNYLVLTPSLRRRLSTNIDAYVDCAFVGSVTDAVLTVTEMRLGAIIAGNALLGPSVAQGTLVMGFGTGVGGVGTYAVTPAQTLPLQLLATGAALLKQPTEITIQCDVHGPLSGDLAQSVSTLLRDDYSQLWFSRQGYAAVGLSLLHADDPRQMPFIDGESQYEDRWVVDIHMQADQVVSAPQDFADRVVIKPTSVQATYPL